MRKTLYAVAVLALITGCIPPGPPPPPMTPEQQEWVARMNAQPPVFTIPSDQGEAAWSRAKLWIANYSDFKLQTVDTVILETYYPPGEAAARFGFQVTRQQLPDGSWRFSVRCVTGNPYAVKTAESSAKILAYYIVSGMDCPGCGAGIRGNPNRL